ncbi:MAG: hypothetical protein DME68_05010 [Verrucomicrobia bacterium]|nr:MAG: hypothetical protein DME81_09280 [Verrucomicrobiota bacterium]PYJ99016.1 MAG: hypothetical protein DME68_05010 [Verrucomicrobiota bacterium]
MAVKILPNQIENIQQLEAVVAGPDDADRLFIIDGQFLYNVNAYSSGQAFVSKETFTVLVGPVFTRRQFVRANATASFTQTVLNINTLPQSTAWQMLGVDADWDDESGQVELRIEAQVNVFGSQNQASILGFGFHVTILAAVAAA